MGYARPDVETAAQQYMQKSGDVDKQILELNSRLSMARYLRDFLTGKVGKNQPDIYNRLLLCSYHRYRIRRLPAVVQAVQRRYQYYSDKL